MLAPDPIMSDQQYRAARFGELGLARIVEGDPPTVDSLVTAIGTALDAPAPAHDFNLDGVAHTGALLADWVRIAPRPSP